MVVVVTKKRGDTQVLHYPERSRQPQWHPTDARAPLPLQVRQRWNLSSYIRVPTRDGRLPLLDEYCDTRELSASLSRADIGHAGLITCSCPSRAGTPYKDLFNPPLSRYWLYCFRVLIHHSLPQMAQVIVVGGGLAGLSAAHTLLERGANVLLLDKQGYVPI